MPHHSFKTHLSWQKHPQAEDTSVRRQLKNHTIQIEEKQTLNISAAKAFKGDPKLLNPEDLLLSSLTSCHMMSYLYVCGQHQIEVLNYEDNAEAILEVNENGSGAITRVVLKPKVLIGTANAIELAQTLHQQAHELCFIANSCKFQIAIESTVELG